MGRPSLKKFLPGMDAASADKSVDHFWHDSSDTEAAETVRY
jgi:hypothetical protein